MTWDNIPQELRDLPRWAVSRSVADKQPLDANRFGSAPASSTDRNTWATFDQACCVAEDIGGLVGFMLSANDPFTVIDLDNKPEKPATPEDIERFNQLLTNCHSYAEVSASGTGVHIITKATLPEDGKRTGNLEVYWSRRYMICTGKAINSLPIAEGEAIQQIVTGVYNWIVGQQRGTGFVDRVEYVQPETDEYTDQEVYERIQRAENFDKFKCLWEGDLPTIQANYPQFTGYSEATYAFIEMLRHYTDNNADQAFRIYLASPISQRPSDPDPAKRRRNLTRKYFDRSWSKNYSRAVSEAGPGLDELKAMYGHLAQPAPAPAETPSNAAAQPDLSYELPTAEPEEVPISLPPGLVGELAQFFYSTAIRQVPEVALCASIAFMAGLCGRAYNVTSIGLNQYVILLAPTGTGKEGAASGIDRLIASLQKANPTINPDSILGPSAFASGQGLIRTLDDNCCFVSIMGEFGISLQQMSDKNASSSQVMLRKVLLDLYNKSGYGQRLYGSAYSDKEKNTKTVLSPAVTILGESTPTRFYEGLSEVMVEEGLIPRFLVVEYTGERPGINPNHGCLPWPGLVQQLTTLFATCGQISAANSVVQVVWDEGGKAVLDAVEHKTTRIINEGRNETINNIWNRVHLKACKLAALVAVGVNPYQPLITAELATWAVRLVEKDASRMLKRFESGNVGDGDNKQTFDMIQVCKEYLKVGYDKVASYDVDRQMHAQNVVPYVYLSRRCSPKASFKNDRLGAKAGLKKTIRDLIDSGLLIQVSASDLYKSFKYNGAAYLITRKHLKSV